MYVILVVGENRQHRTHKRPSTLPICQMLMDWVQWQSAPHIAESRGAVPTWGVSSSRVVQPTICCPASTSKVQGLQACRPFGPMWEWPVLPPAHPSHAWEGRLETAELRMGNSKLGFVLASYRVSPSESYSSSRLPGTKTPKIIKPQPVPRSLAGSS